MPVLTNDGYTNLLAKGRRGDFALNEARAMKEYNITGICFPYRLYTVDLTSWIVQIKATVDKILYFRINRGRQYGKTMTLNALGEALANDHGASEFQVGYSKHDSMNYFMSKMVKLVK